MNDSLFTLEFWVYECFIAIVFMALMASGVHRLVARRGSRVLAVLFCLLAYGASAGLAIGHEWLRDKTASFLVTVKSPAPPAYLPNDWGADFSKEDRARFSLILARKTFEHWGEKVEYYDGNGLRVRLEPSAEDLLRRANYLLRINTMEREISRLLAVAIAWLFIPLVGVAFAFTSIADRVFLLSKGARNGS